MNSESPARHPYKGPSPYDESDEKKFFGRAKDLELLRGVLRTERIVVLHAASGIGKTSLLQAGLIPQLRGDGFKVLSPIRVNHPLPQQVAPSEVSNRYSYSVIRSIETALAATPANTDTGPGEGGNYDIPLSTYFAHRSALREGEQRLLLVFDQFEEVFTIAPYERSARLQFFRELGTVLQDKTIWTVFAIREEYVGALDPYSRLVPTHFAGRFHLNALTRDMAEEAIRRPVEEWLKIPFEPEAVQKILSDLERSEKTREAAGAEAGSPGMPPETGETVIDPLHLQLVCDRVWTEFQKNQTERVTAEAVVGWESKDTKLTAVDAALMQYYDITVEKAAKESGLPERGLRDWIERELIAEDGIRRRQALAAPEAESKLAKAESSLERGHVLRAGLRANSTWYELAHDRFLLPVCRSNDLWYSKKLALFEQNARKWYRRGKPQNFGATPLRDWLSYVFRSRKNAGKEWEFPYEKEYLALFRRRTLLTGVILLVGVLCFVGSWLFYSFSHLEIDKLGEKYFGLQEETEKKKAELAQITRKLEKTQHLNLARRLQGAAMEQRYVYQNHDVTLLLGHFAREILKAEGGGIASDNESTLNQEVDQAIWAALEARPFSQTLPEATLGGKPQALMPATPGARLVVARGEGWQVASLNLEQDQFQLDPACVNFPHYYAPDASYLVMVREKALRILDASNCLPITVVNPPAEKAFAEDKAPVFSADGHYLAVFLEDGAVSVLEVVGKDFNALGCIDVDAVSADDKGGTKYPISAVAFYKSCVAVGDDGGGVRVFDVTTLQTPRQRFPGYEPDWPFYGYAKFDRRYAEILALALTDEAPGWLTTVHRGGLHIAGGFVLRRPLVEGEAPHLVTSDQESTLREELSKEFRVLSDSPSGERFLSASFEPDGRWLVTGGEQGTVILWDLREPRGPKEGMGALGEVCESTDAYPLSKVSTYVVPRRILVGMVGGAQDVLSTVVKRTHADDNTSDMEQRTVLGIDSAAGVRMWDLTWRAGSYLNRDWARGCNDYSYAVAFDSRNRLITSTNKGKVRALQVEREPLRTDGVDYDFTLKKETSIRALDVQGTFVALGLGDQNASLVNLENPSFLQHLRDQEGHSPHTDGLWAVAFRPGDTSFGSKFDLATGDYKGKLVFWDLESISQGKELRSSVSGSCKYPAWVKSLAFHPGGRWLLVGTSTESLAAEQKGQLYLVDMEGRFCVEPIGFECSGGPCVAWTRDAIVEATGNRTVMPPVRSVAFSADGSRLSAAGDYGMVWSWELSDSDTPTVSRTGTVLGGARGKVNALKFKPDDNRTIIAVGQDAALRSWSLKPGSTGKPLVLRQAGTELLSLAVSRDGQLIAAGDARGQLHLWDLDTSRYICPLVLRNLTWNEWLTKVYNNKVYCPVCPNRLPPLDLPEGMVVKEAPCSGMFSDNDSQAKPPRDK